MRTGVIKTDRGKMFKKKSSFKDKEKPKEIFLKESKTSIISAIIVAIAAGGAWFSAIQSAKSVKVLIKESNLRTRPYLSCIDPVSTSDSEMKVKNWGEIPATRVKVRRKYCLERKDGKEEWFGGSFGSAEDCINPREEGTYALLITNELASVLSLTDLYIWKFLS